MFGLIIVLQTESFRKLQTAGCFMALSQCSPGVQLQSSKTFRDVIISAMKFNAELDTPLFPSSSLFFI